MRVERTGSTPAVSPSPRAKPGEKTPETVAEPGDSWDGATVDDREATADSKEELLGLLLPGIAEGLSKEYLGSVASTAPTTLLSPCLQPAPFDLTQFPNRSDQYAENLADQTKELFKKFLPECFLDLDLLIQVESGETNNAGYEWVQGKSRLTLQTVAPLPAEAPHMQRTQSTLDPDTDFRRGVCDLVSFVHEYGHAVYDALLGVPASVDVDCANRSFSEGFAVLMELLILDHLSLLDAEHTFESDKTDLRKRRNQRIHWLQQVLTIPTSAAHQAYAEGTELMANLFRTGGLDRVVRFVKTVVPNKANSLARHHPDYRKAVGDPRRMGKLVFLKT